MKGHEELTDQEIKKVLQAGRYTTLALIDGNDPYILNLYYGLDPQERILYFYTEKEGLKLDFLKSNPYVCGTVVEQPTAMDKREKEYYRSVVYRGIMEVIHNEKEQKKAMDCINSQIKGTFSVNSRSATMIMKLELEETEGRAIPCPTPL